MRILLLAGLLGLTAMTGCAIVYTYGDYADGNQGGGGSGDVSCDKASDCPGEDSFCARRVCESGKCAIDATPKDTVLTTQQVGDCSQKVCDGNGSVVDVADATDRPDDNNQCTKDLCERGVPKNPPEPKGARCGGGGATACDGEGHCTGCRGPGDCPASSGCIQWACVDKACQATNADAGTPCGGASSCQRDNELISHQCDGNGTCSDVSESCGLFRCQEGGCLSSCTSAMDCVGDLKCDLGDCSDCLTCGQWLESGPLNQPTNFCDRSLPLATDLADCVCSSDCSWACDAFCFSSGSLDPRCAECARNSCPAYSTCVNDR